MIENVLGAAFVLAQARLTAVASEAIEIAKELGPLAQALPFALPKVSRDSLLAFGAPMKGHTVTAVTAIDAVANYFKHRDEWSNWTPNKKNQATITTISAIGLLPTSTGNLRAAAKVLGWPDAAPADLSWMEGAIDEWATAVLVAIKKAI